MPTQAPTDSDLGFPAKGSLKRVPFPFLVRDIARTRTTGNLYLMAGDTKKVVFFVDGMPTVVRSNLPSEFLGQILTDQGLITQEQCDNTLEAIRRTGKKQGELLVEMGILSEGNLRYGLDEQLRIKLFEIFGWEEGRFQFKVGGEGGIGTSGFGFEGPVESVVLAGVQERWNDERARAALKLVHDKFPTVHPRWAGDLAQSLELLPEELYFLRSIDGSRTTDELLAKKNDPEVPQVSTLLFGLIAAGVVDTPEAKQARRLPPPRPNLTPQSPPDETWIPRFEQLSVITEFEDTPLPDKAPSSPALTGRHPRVPILPTEDEEMFRGLDGDDSIVIDSRGLRAGRTPPASNRPTPDQSTLGMVDETHFGDLAADDDETDFSSLSSTSLPKPGKPDSGRMPAARPDPQARADSGKSPLPQPAPKPDTGKSALPKLDTGKTAPPKPDSGGSALPQPPLGARADSGKSPLPQPTFGARPDSAKSPLPQPTPRPDSAKSPLPQPTPRPDSAKSAAPTLGARLDSSRLAAPVPAVATPAPAEEPLLTPDPLLGDLAIDDDLSLDDDIDGEIEMLDDDEMLGDLDDEPDLGDLGGDLGGELGGDLGSEPDLGDEPSLGEPSLGDLPALGDDDDDLGALAARDGADGDDAPEEPPLDLGQMGDSSLSEPLGDSALRGDEDDGEPPGTELDPGGLDAPGLDDDLGDEPGTDLGAAEPDLGDDAGGGALDEDLGELGEGELEDLELDDDALIEDDDELGDMPAGPNEDTDGGYQVDGGVESAEALGATRFAQGEDAMREGDWDQAVVLFEDAYANGFDIAELHAHLAFARYRASDNDPETAQAALDLLDYAESIDPGLPILHAYRGAVLVAVGREDEAVECFDRALYLDPNNELALAYRRDE
ncbi:MAG: tetratricopeptide repeat protein [Myxococcales bacterium]|nr:tetratricopeptide repeat protein [Myxococcales bacterium]